MTARQARAAKRRKAFARRIGASFARAAERSYQRLSRSFFTAEYLRFASAPYESDALLRAAGYGDTSKSERYTYIPALPPA